MVRDKYQSGVGEYQENSTVWYGQPAGGVQQIVGGKAIFLEGLEKFKFVKILISRRIT
jgi:hypothetical protein